MSRLTALIRAWKTRGPRRRAWMTLPLVREGFPVACCWSAKAGCTTVLKWFLQHNGLLEEATQHGPWLHDYRLQRLIEEPGYERRCRRALRSDSVHVIKVIRDPAKRAVSAYLHYLRSASSSWPGECVLAAWKTANGLGAQQGVSFRQFLECVLDLQRHSQSMEPHVRPQYDRACDPYVDAYIPLENLAAGLEETERLCGLPHVTVQAMGESLHHNRPCRQHRWPSGAAGLPATSKTLDELGVPPAELLLDETTLPMVWKPYGVDYRAYASHYHRR